MGLLQWVGISPAGSLNRDPFVQDWKIGAMTSLLTAAVVLVMVAVGVVCNINKPGLDTASLVHIHPSSPNKDSPHEPRSLLSTKTLGNSIRERDYDKKINKEV